MNTDIQRESAEALKGAIGIEPGDTVYTSHHKPETYLKLFVAKVDNKGNPAIFNITWHVANVIGWKPKEKDGEWYVRNDVGGMDRGFDTVYTLSRLLFGDGYALNHEWL